MLSDEETSKAVKTEVMFFMEKTFQVSFGYLGALAALAVAAKIDGVAALASAVRVDTRILIAASVLLANAVYLTLACGTLFAVLKRGLFLMSHGAKFPADGVGLVQSEIRDWEVFVRRPPISLVRRQWATNILWNLDNFYMVPLFGLIGVASIAVFVFGLAEQSTGRELAVLLLVAALQAAPAIAVFAVARLAAKCDRLASTP